MEYLVLAGACIAFAPMFLFNKAYQRRSDQSIEASLWVSVITGVITVLFGLPLCGFRPTGSLPSLLYACGFAASCVFCGAAIFLALRQTRVAVVSLFMYSGGLLLPSLYGIFFHGEPVTVWKVIGILLICSSFLPSLLEGRGDQKKSGRSVAWILLLAFVSNGMIGVFSKANVMHPAGAENADFIVMAGFWDVVIVFLLLGINKLFHKDATLSPRCIAADGKPRTYLLQVLTIALCTVTNSISNILSLMANAMMDSSIQYPIFNAAQICLAALLSALVLKEKPNTATIIQTGVCVVGILTLLL